MFDQPWSRPSRAQPSLQTGQAEAAPQPEVGISLILSSVLNMTRLYIPTNHQKRKGGSGKIMRFFFPERIRIFEEICIVYYFVKILQNWGVIFQFLRNNKILLGVLGKSISPILRKE